MCCAPRFGNAAVRSIRHFAHRVRLRWIETAIVAVFGRIVCDAGELIFDFGQHVCDERESRKRVTAKLGFRHSFAKLLKSFRSCEDHFIRMRLTAYAVNSMRLRLRPDPLLDLSAHPAAPSARSQARISASIRTVSCCLTGRQKGSRTERRQNWSVSGGMSE